MAIPTDFLDDLRARLRLVDVIGKHVRLTRKGRDYLGLCPFHQEKTPSFTVNEEKGFYHCFGCGAHGSLFDFVMMRERIGFREAVERLAAEAGLSLPRDLAPEGEGEPKRRQQFAVLDAAARYFEGALRLPEGKEALAYLRRRGLDDDLIGRFRLGFAPEGGQGLRRALARDGIGEDDQVESGLLIRPEDGARPPYARFRNRVMFPILDARGRVIAFGGRVLGKGEPKYLNSPETPLFHKGRTLYGLAQALAAVRTAEAVIVAEGYMDVIGLHGAGFTHAVAPLGTALTPEQIALLWRLAPEPVLLFDPDEAGERAAARAALRALPLVKSGFGLRFAFLRTDTGDDPDGVVRRYPPQFLEAALAEALSLSDMIFAMETQGRRLRTPEDRAGAESRLLTHGEAITDPLLRARFRQAFRERLRREFRAKGERGRGRSSDSGRPPAAIAATGPFSAHGRPARPAAAGAASGKRKPDKGSETDRLCEQILLAVVLNHPATLETVGERLGLLRFSSTDLDSLRQAILMALSSGEDLDSTGLKSHLSRCGFSTIVESVLSPHVLKHARFAAADAELDTAVQGWKETVAIYRQRTIPVFEARRRLLLDEWSADGIDDQPGTVGGGNGPARSCPGKP